MANPQKRNKNKQKKEKKEKKKTKPRVTPSPPLHHPPPIAGQDLKSVFADPRGCRHRKHTIIAAVPLVHQGARHLGKKLGEHSGLEAVKETCCQDVQRNWSTPIHCG